jgi:hypothetical protein
LVNPVTTHGLPGQVAVLPAGEDVTVYEVMAAPPSLAGGVKLTLAWPSPAVAEAPVGAPGAEAGVTAVEALDSAELPWLLVACTVNVYAVPSVRPVITHGLPGQVLLMPPGLAVTV